MFQNLLVRNEFLVLSDTDPPTVDRLAHRISSNLAKFLGAAVEVAVSEPYFSLPKTAEAYRQARASLLVRPFNQPAGVLWTRETVHVRPVTRVTGEHEMLLNLAVSAADGRMVRDILLEKVGLRTQAQGWLLAELRQTLDYVIRFLLHRAPIPPASRRGLAQEVILGQLDQGIRNRDLDEVVRVLEHWVEEVFGGTEAAATSLPMRQTVGQVKDYIETHYFEDLSLATLSECFRVDASYLSKAYKAVTGVNLMAAIARCRIDHAQEFIRDRDLSLTEIASLVGYEEYAYFNRVFRKVRGISPTEYKRSVRRPDDEPR